MTPAHQGPKALWEPRVTLVRTELQVILVLQAHKEIQDSKVILDLKGKKAIKGKVTKGPLESPGSQALEVCAASKERVTQEAPVPPESRDPLDTPGSAEGPVCQGSATCPCATRATTSGTTTARAPASDLQGPSQAEVPLPFAVGPLWTPDTDCFLP